ncbi:hypothetical protein Q8G41_29190, partial [Klebsiella pneumoniae]|uniref:hypothetical protein n=1 Tax=Klebsiella pneumoniae TaxID=573 RepID=UPI003013FB1B
ADTERIEVDGAIAGGSRLPEPRADATAVTLGRVAYLVGGYAGAVMDPEVLATRTGAAFADVAALAVPVRYPAVASL